MAKLIVQMNVQIIILFSKPITYSLTLEELGLETVHKYQGREPSGRMFNEIALDHNSNEKFRNFIMKFWPDFLDWF
jgi:glutaminase